MASGARFVSTVSLAIDPLIKFSSTIIIVILQQIILHSSILSRSPDHLAARCRSVLAANNCYVLVCYICFTFFRQMATKEMSQREILNCFSNIEHWTSWPQIIIRPGNGHINIRLGQQMLTNVGYHVMSWNLIHV